MLASTGTAKVAVNVTTTVTQPVTVYDATTDSDVIVTCSVPADCAQYSQPGSPATCTSSQCVRSISVNSRLYVKNQTGTHLNDPVLVPCDGTGRTYTIEVYGSNQTGGPFTVNTADMKTSVPFTMSAGCAPSPTITAASWIDLGAPGSLPTLLFPTTIYVGLPAPYDRYAVQAQNAHYPWSTSTWSVVQGAINPLGYSGASATFAAPTTNPANNTLAFQASFYLDSSLLVGGEGATAWGRSTPFSAPVVPSGGIGLP